jgi:hypothetical protein
MLNFNDSERKSSFTPIMPTEKDDLGVNEFL